MNSSTFCVGKGGCQIHNILDGYHLLNAYVPGSYYVRTVSFKPCNNWMGSMMAPLREAKSLSWECPTNHVVEDLTIHLFSLGHEVLGLR